MTDTLCSFNMWVIFLFASLINELFAIPRVFISCSIYPDSHFFFHWSPSCLTAEKILWSYILHYLELSLSNFSVSLPFIDILVFLRKKGLKSFLKFKNVSNLVLLKLIFPLFFLHKGFKNRLDIIKVISIPIWNLKPFIFKKRSYVG